MNQICPCTQCITRPICRNKIKISFIKESISFQPITSSCIILTDYIWDQVRKSNREVEIKRELIEDIFKIQNFHNYLRVFYKFKIDHNIINELSKIFNICPKYSWNE